MVEEDSLRGVTVSNPARTGGDPRGVTNLAVASRQGLSARGSPPRREGTSSGRGHARGRVRGDRAARRTGYVSPQVAPRLAMPTPEAASSRRASTGLVDRPNPATIKHPATEAGVPAIEQALYEGMNEDATLLFAVSAYEQVMEAFNSRATERDGGRTCRSHRHSFSPFFVSP